MKKILFKNAASDSAEMPAQYWSAFGNVYCVLFDCSVFRRRWLFSRQCSRERLRTVKLSALCSESIHDFPGSLWKSSVLPLKLCLLLTCHVPRPRQTAWGCHLSAFFSFFSRGWKCLKSLSFSVLLTPVFSSPFNCQSGRNETLEILADIKPFRSEPGRQGHECC